MMTRNHLAIAQLSSQLNISLGLKRAVDAKALGAVVRNCTARNACACNVCGRVQLWTELANHREWRFGGEGGAEDFEIAECACANTLSRVIATRTVAA